MRILHIVHQYLPDHVGGTEHHVRSLAEQQASAGHQVTIVCRRSAPVRRLEVEDEGGLRIYRAVSGPFTPAGRFRSTLHDPFLAGCLRRVIAEAQPDLIHIHHLMGLPAAVLIGAAAATPTVATLHDYWWVCANSQLYTDYGARVCDGPRAWLNCARCGLARSGLPSSAALAAPVAPLFATRALILARLLRRIAAWIAPTAFVRDWHSGHGIPAAKTHIIGHGIELPGPVEPLRPTGSSLHLVYVGGLAPQKGVHVAIEAFNGLPASATLTIAGDESAFPDYVQRLRALAVHPGIRFAGRLDRSRVWQTLAGADAVVVPSVWYETACLVIQEAFAVGAPAVVSGHGALAERVRHEVDGLRVPPGDARALLAALRRLADEPGLVDRLKGGIGPVVTLAQQAAEVETLYRQVLTRA